MFNDHQTEQIDRVLNDVADELLDAADIDAPPVDVLRLAGALGMLVAWDQGQSGRARLVRMSGGSSRAARSTIFLRPEPRAERQHWAVAHEIGEHAVHHVFDRLAIDPRDDRPTNRERVADALASRLLLPKRWYLEDARHGGWDLFALKSRYATASHELIARRMLDFDEPVIITIFDQGQVHLRRGNFGLVPRPTPVELRCRIMTHRSGIPGRLEDPLLRVHGWPIHQDGWQREILRSEPREFT